MTALKCTACGRLVNVYRSLGGEDRYEFHDRSPHYPAPCRMSGKGLLRLQRVAQDLEQAVNDRFLLGRVNP